MILRHNETDIANLVIGEIEYGDELLIYLDGNNLCTIYHDDVAYTFATPQTVVCGHKRYKGVVRASVMLEHDRMAVKGRMIQDTSGMLRVPHIEILEYIGSSYGLGDKRAYIELEGVMNYNTNIEYNVAKSGVYGRTIEETARKLAYEEYKPHVGRLYSEDNKRLAEIKRKYSAGIEVVYGVIKRLYSKKNDIIAKEISRRLEEHAKHIEDGKNCYTMLVSDIEDISTVEAAQIYNYIGIERPEEDIIEAKAKLLKYMLRKSNNEYFVEENDSLRVVGALLENQSSYLAVGVKECVNYINIADASKKYIVSTLEGSIVLGGGEVARIYSKVYESPSSRVIRSNAVEISKSPDRISDVVPSKVISSVMLSEDKVEKLVEGEFIGVGDMLGKNHTVNSIVKSKGKDGMQIYNIEDFCYSHMISKRIAEKIIGSKIEMIVAYKSDIIADAVAKIGQKEFRKSAIVVKDWALAERYNDVAGAIEVIRASDIEREKSTQREIKTVVIEQSESMTLEELYNAISYSGTDGRIVLVYRPWQCQEFTGNSVVRGVLRIISKENSNGTVHKAKKAVDRHITTSEDIKYIMGDNYSGAEGGSAVEGIKGCDVFSHYMLEKGNIRSSISDNSAPACEVTEGILSQYNKSIGLICRGTSDISDNGVFIVTGRERAMELSTHGIMTKINDGIIKGSRGRVRCVVKKTGQCFFGNDSTGISGILIEGSYVIAVQDIITYEASIMSGDILMVVSINIKDCELVLKNSRGDMFTVSSVNSRFLESAECVSIDMLRGRRVNTIILNMTQEGLNIHSKRYFYSAYTIANNVVICGRQENVIRTLASAEEWRIYDWSKAIVNGKRYGGKQERVVDIASSLKEQTGCKTRAYELLKEYIEKLENGSDMDLASNTSKGSEKLIKAVIS